MTTIKTNGEKINSIRLFGIKENNRNNQFTSIAISSMVSLIIVVCIIGFNVKKIDTFTTEDATYAFEIEEKNYKNHVIKEVNEKAKLHFENSLDLMSIISKQLLDVNKFSDININVYELPLDVSVKPCKYRYIYIKCFSKLKFNV